MATPVIASAGSARQELNHPAEIVALFQRLGLRAPKYHNKLANFHKCYIEHLMATPVIASAGSARQE